MTKRAHRIESWEWATVLTDNSAICLGNRWPCASTLPHRPNTGSSTLVSNPDVRAKTVLFITYDENGGLFNHAPPPTAPPRTPGEYLTAATLPPAAGGITGPVGLGFWVPCLVVSPVSRGGWYCSDTFDHTSPLRFIETRFDVPVPKLTAWRRNVTGNLTTDLLKLNPKTSVPTLPTTTVLQDTSTAEAVVVNALARTERVGQAYEPPMSNMMPVQETTPTRRATG